MEHRNRRIVLRSSRDRVNGEGGPVKVEVRRRVLIVKPKLDKVVEILVLLENDNLAIPKNINVLQTLGDHTIECNGETFSGTVIKIMAVGQAIHDWVKKMNKIWVTSAFPNQAWTQVKAA